MCYTCLGSLKFARLADMLIFYGIMRTKATYVFLTLHSFHKFSPVADEFQLGTFSLDTDTF